MAHRPHQSELLAWIEGEPLAAEEAAAVRDAFEKDPDLRRWAEAARTDRERLRALAEIDAAGAPQGLAETAMELAEREWLVGDAFEPRRHARRIRVTPVRLVAAASVVIIAGAASLIGFVLNPNPNPHSNQFFAHAPQSEHENTLAFADRADFERVAAAGPSAEIEQASARAKAPDPSALLARTVVGQSVDAATDHTEPIETEFSEAMKFAAAAPPAPTVGLRGPARAVQPMREGLTFRLIHPAEHAPEHAVAPVRAAELAREGRLLLLVRTSDPAAVEQALLSRTPESAAAARWRSILELGNAGGASPGSDAARVALVDVFATPSSLEQLIGEVTTAVRGAEGAWLQEMADPVRLEPRFEPADFFFWNRPPSAWAPRTTLPVLIERVAPGPDAASPDPGLAP